MSKTPSHADLVPKRSVDLDEMKAGTTVFVEIEATDKTLFNRRTTFVLHVSADTIAQSDNRTVMNIEISVMQLNVLQPSNCVVITIPASRWSNVMRKLRIGWQVSLISGLSYDFVQRHSTGIIMSINVAGKV